MANILQTLVQIADRMLSRPSLLTEKRHTSRDQVHGLYLSDEKRSRFYTRCVRERCEVDVPFVLLRWQLHEHREFCVLCRFGAVKSVSLKVRSVQRPNRNVLLFPGSIETVLFASLCIYCLING